MRHPHINGIGTQGVKYLNRMQFSILRLPPFSPSPHRALQLHTLEQQPHENKALLLIRPRPSPTPAYERQFLDASSPSSSSHQVEVLYPLLRKAMADPCSSVSSPMARISSSLNSPRVYRRRSSATHA